MADITLELRLGHSRRLEVELVEDGVLILRHDGARADLASRPVWHAEADHTAEAIGAQQRGVPRYRSSPVVTGDHSLLSTQRIEQTDHVANQMQKRVLVDRLGTIGPAVTAHVGCDDVESSRGERRQLMAPGIPGFWKTVAKHDQGARHLLGQVHAYAVRLAYAVAQLAHQHDLLPAKGPGSYPR